MFSNHVCVVMGVYFAEKINYYLGRNWEKFATQDYFDKHVFFSVKFVAWSSPNHFNNNIGMFYEMHGQNKS